MNICENGYNNTSSNASCLLFLQEEGDTIEKWLKGNGCAKCIGASFELVYERLGRIMDFEYNGNIKDLDKITLLDKLSKWVVSRDLGIMVNKYDDEEHRNMFSVTIWFLEEPRENI